MQIIVSKMLYIAPVHADSVPGNGKGITEEGPHWGTMSWPGE